MAFFPFLKVQVSSALFVKRNVSEFYVSKGR